MKYTASLYVFESPDARSHAFRFIDHKTGKRTEALVHAGESNVKQLMYELGYSHDNLLYCLIPATSARQFSNTCEGMVTLGSAPKEMSIFVRATLDLGEKTFKVSGYEFSPTALAGLYYASEDAVSLCEYLEQRRLATLTLGQGAKLLARLNKYRK